MSHTPKTFLGVVRLCLFMPMFCITGTFTLWLMKLAMGHDGMVAFIEGLAGKEHAERREGMEG